MRMMSWELGHFITHLCGISFMNSWKLAKSRPLAFPMVQILVIERNRFFGFGQNRNRNPMGFGKPKPKLKPKLTPNI